MTNKKLPDKYFVSQFKQGNVSAYEELLKRYTEKVFHLAMRITRNQDDAEEVLQDVFTSVYSKIQSFQERSAFSSWLYRITVNTAYMKLRVRKKHAALGLDETCLGSQQSWASRRSDNSDISFMSTRHQLRERLVDAVGKLPKDYQTIFILRDIDGLSNQEVSDALDLSVPAVKSRLHRARLSLRKSLQPFFDDYKSEDKISYGDRVQEAM